MHLNGIERKRPGPEQTKRTRNRAKAGNEPQNKSVAGYQSNGKTQEQTDQRKADGSSQPVDRPEPPRRLVKVHWERGEDRFYQRHHDQQDSDDVRGAAHSTCMIQWTKHSQRSWM